MDRKPRLCLIGAGRVGRTLAKLWHEKQIFSIDQVITRSLESATAAAAFIGSGKPALLGTVSASEVFLLATPDDQISSACQALCQTRTVLSGSVVFHCSGLLSSTALQPATKAGAFTASVHPLKSFASPSGAAVTFSGTYCAYEGDPQALSMLLPAFRSLGAQLLPLSAEKKPLYHAAAQMVCGHLVSLLDCGFTLMESSGTTPGQARALLASLIRETVENVLRLGPQAALTGPIARGDLHTVTQHVHAIERTRPEFSPIYRELGLQILERLVSMEHSHPTLQNKLRCFLQDAISKRPGQRAAPAPNITGGAALNLEANSVE